MSRQIESGMQAHESLARELGNGEPARERLVPPPPPPPPPPPIIIIIIISLRGKNTT
jgi:hypothetical protein